MQGAFLSQIPSLFILEHLSKSELSIIKLCGYIGMALGIWFVTIHDSQTLVSLEKSLRFLFLMHSDRNDQNLKIALLATIIHAQAPSDEYRL
jgi:hypothetical protein